MVDPEDRTFAKPYNDRESRYLRGLDFEARMRFIEAAADNVGSAADFYVQQMESIGRPDQPGQEVFFQYIGTFLPTPENGSDQLISRPTVGCLLVEDMDNPSLNSLEIRVPVDENFSLNNPADIASLKHKKEVYLIESHTDSTGKKTVKYYFVWEGGFGHYDPISDEQDEHDIEFQFFLENLDRLGSEFSAPEILALHEKLIAYKLWFYNLTPLDFGESKTA